jgi:hypothetical protein
MDYHQKIDNSVFVYLKMTALLERMLEQSQSPQHSDFIRYFYEKYKNMRAFSIKASDAANFIGCDEIDVIHACNNHLEIRKDYKFVYNGRYVKLTSHGFVLVCQAMNTAQTRRLVRWIHDMNTTYIQYLDEFVPTTTN